MMVTWGPWPFKDIHGRLEFSWAQCLAARFARELE
jgi:hypothetical protein